MPDPPEGHDVVLEIDVYGAEQIRELDPSARLIFIDAPDRDEQRRRLEARGDAPERVAERLAKSDEEVEVAERLGMTVVVNDDVDRTVAEIQDLLATWRIEDHGP